MASGTTSPPHRRCSITEAPPVDVQVSQCQQYIDRTERRIEELNRPRGAGGPGAFATIARGSRSSSESVASGDARPPRSGTSQRDGLPVAGTHPNTADVDGAASAAFGAHDAHHLSLDSTRLSHSVSKKRKGWTEDELLRVRTCWTHGQRLLVQGNEQGQCRTQQQGQARQRQRQRKHSVNEITTPTESTTTPPVGPSASQISRITQDDTRDRPVPTDEDEDESFAKNWTHLGSGPAKRTIQPIQRLVCCARIGGQWRGWACVLSTRC